MPRQVEVNGGVLGVSDLGNTRQWILIAFVSAGCIESLNLSRRVGQDIHPSPCLISMVKLQTVEAKLWTEPNVTWTCSYKGKAEYSNTKGSFTNFLCVTNSQMLGQACFQNTITPDFTKSNYFLKFHSTHFMIMRCNFPSEVCTGTWKEPQCMHDVGYQFRSNWVTRPQYKFWILTRMGT
jgi:hypothetical protein